MRKAVVAAPARLQLILDLVEAKRAANGHESIHRHAIGHAFEAVRGDHRSHAVRDDDMRSAHILSAHRLDEAFADRLLDVDGCRPAGAYSTSNR